MAYLVYCIEIAKGDQAKAEATMHKHYVNGDIDIKHMEHSMRNHMVTIQYWFTFCCSDDIAVIVNELKADGIEVF